MCHQVDVDHNVHFVNESIFPSEWDLIEEKEEKSEVSIKKLDKVAPLMTDPPLISSTTL